MNTRSAFEIPFNSERASLIKGSIIQGHQRGNGTEDAAWSMTEERHEWEQPYTARSISIFTLIHIAIALNTSTVPGIFDV